MNRALLFSHLIKMLGEQKKDKRNALPHDVLASQRKTNIAVRKATGGGGGQRMSFGCLVLNKANHRVCVFLAV
jgi:hypothetical protein